MIKNFSGLLLALLITSCNQSSEKPEPEVSKSSYVQELNDPKQFIGEHKAKAMVLGVFHFNNPGLDSYKQQHELDILSSKKQAELDSLIHSLQIYGPTKILIEVPRKEGDSIINHRYQQYLKGNFDISDKKDEVYQLAFQLAKQLGHTRIYASDARNSEWFGAEIDWETYNSAEYAKSLNQYEKKQRYNYQKIYELNDSLKIVNSLQEHLKYLNDPQSRLKNHQAYLTQTILTGAGDLYIGADAVARWYQRNLKIFANTYDLADFSREDKILLIYGAGHVWQLRQLLKDSPDFEYVEANEYL
jgi:hypothetical protein